MASDRAKNVKKKASRTSFGRRKGPHSSGQSGPLRQDIPSIPSNSSKVSLHGHEHQASPSSGLNGPTKRAYSGLESPTHPSADGRLSTPKRSRSAAWNDQKGASSVSLTDEIPEIPQPALESRSSSPIRKSRFLEHQTSTEVLPSNYIPQLDGTHDDIFSRVKQDVTDTKEVESRKSATLSVPNSGAPSQDSSFYRFGKSIASAFRPTTVWSNLSSIWKQNQALRAEQSDSLQQNSRQSSTLAARPDQGDLTSPIRGSLSGNGDSAIDVGYQSSLSSPGSANVNKASASVSDFTAPWFSPSPQKTPVSKLLRSIKSKKSAPALSSASKSTDYLPSTFSNASVETLRLAGRTPPSKKDLRRQRKLTKKVSNLEEQLERAKEELHKALVDAPPMPPIPDRFTMGVLPRVSTVAEFATEVTDQLESKRYSSMAVHLGSPSSSSASSTPSKVSATIHDGELLDSMISSLQKDETPSPPPRKSPVARLSLPRVLAKLSPDSAEKTNRESAKRKADSDASSLTPEAETPRPNKLRRSSPNSATSASTGSPSDTSERESLPKIPSIPKEGKSFIPVAVTDPEKRPLPFPPRSIPVIVEDVEPFEWPEDVF